MSRKFFLTILEGMRDYNSYFRCKPDATGKLGFIQKESTSIRIRAYGVVGDLIYE
jgi:hypothetical protein